jgi:7-cyano-7-deazaguanine synthase
MRKDARIILCSGGLNSTVAAARGARDGAIYLLHVDYGQPAADRERSAVEAIGKGLGAERVLGVDMPHVRSIAAAGRRRDTPPAGDAILPGPPIPCLLDAAYQWAARIAARAVVIGAAEAADESERPVGGGPGGLPLRREFFHACGVMFEELRWGRPVIRLETPFIGLSRDDVVKIGRRFGAPLDLCWCCQEAGPHACGQCPGCRARESAVASAGGRGPALAAR